MPAIESDRQHLSFLTSAGASILTGICATFLILGLIAAPGLRLIDGYTELDVAGELGLEKRGEARLLVGTCKSSGLLI